MTIEKMIEAGMRAFKENMETFCGDAAQEELTPESATRVARGLQEVVKAVGSSSYRAFLESKEQPQDIVSRNGQAFRFKYASEKRFMGLWGPMGVTRRVYQNAADTKTFVPLDAAWGMEDKYLTEEVEQAVALASAYLTPVETNVLLQKSALFHPHPTQIKRALESIGKDLVEYGDVIDGRIRKAEEVPAQTKVLAASMDGVNVMLREEGEKRGRPSERPQLRKGPPGKTAYKNAMVGSISFYGAVPPQEKTPERLGSRYVSHMPEENAVTFKAKFEAELDAAEVQAPSGVTKVLLCDGARNIWTYIEESGRYTDYEKLVDYWHTLEHLSLAAEAIFGKGTDKARYWFGRYARKLREDDNGAQSAMRSMAYYSKSGKLSSARRDALATQQTFFRRNHHRMTYADFRQRGLPIGSGPVEAACKALVKTRLCRSGMRWTREGGQCILQLRTYTKSNRWDAFWQNYKELKNAA